MNYENRIVRYDTEDPKALIPNDRNWRLHPEAQRLAVAGALEEIGWIDEVTVNLRTSEKWTNGQRNVQTVIDGHLRRDIALAAKEQTVPVKYVDLDPEEEALALATFDPLTSLAETDAAVLSELLSDLDPENAALSDLLEDLAENLEFVDEGDIFPGEGEEDEDASDGSLLELVDVVVAEPRHEVRKGETWNLGDHVLICTDVMMDHAAWAVHLLDDNDIFCPYPGPLVALTKKAEEHRLVLVQPDTYIAGHILDRYADVNGEDSVGRNH